jgi:site-specific recombinase XerC
VSRFSYAWTVKQTWFDQEIIKPKMRRKLPTVWSREEVQALLDAPMNTKHRASVTLYYSASKRMINYSRDGKGKFPRQVMLWFRLLKLVRP